MNPATPCESRRPDGKTGDIESLRRGTSQKSAATMAALVWATSSEFKK